MKKFVYILVVSFFFTASCSTRKNTFVNRNYHKMTAKYNVLYNGNLALEKGIKELANKYEDNFWEILPIEPLEIEEEESFILPGEGEGKNSKSSFEIAEEKAVKAVQKHSMNIDGDEHNKQIDNAYLLLGKARYYSQRFVPALEAFDFLLKNFYIEDKTHDLRIWKAKTQIRLQNEDRAIKTLRNLLSYSYKEIGEETREKAHTTLAMAYMAIDSVSLAIEQLSKATETNYNKNQYARNLIILGQLYRQENNLDSSQVAFQKVIDYTKSPYRYKIHAYIEQAKNITDSTNYKNIQEQFTQIIKEYENKEYLDELYYQAALMNFRDGDEKLALDNLTNSAHTPLAKNFQKGLSYEKAGDYYFDKAQFINAGAYYDSVLATVKNDNTKRIRKLRRKRISLEEVIDYETVLKNNDSILAFVAMDESERRAYFEKYIADLKETEKIAAIVKENEERANNATTGFGDNTKFGNGITSNDTGKTGKWYFYNAQAVGFGKSTFQKVWGNRRLQDNWRLSKETEKDNNNKSNITSLSDNEIVEQSKKYDIEYYLNSIPSDEKEIQKMHDENNNALYQLGLIYKEKFQEYSLAAQRLERFLAEKPKAKFILPARYHLYKIYEITGNTKLEIVKQKILTDYPDSRFAKIIQNPEDLTNPDAKKIPEVHYEKVYCDYEYEKYASVLDECETAVKQYINDPIQAKFELLKSYAIYKLHGKEPFMTNLEYVVDNFPKTEESDHAQEILDLLNGVKKPTKTKNQKKVLMPGGKKEKMSKPAQRPSNNRTKNMGNKRESSKRQQGKSNNREGRNNNPSSRPPKGSNNKPPGNNNQNGDQIGG